MIKTRQEKKKETSMFLKYETKVLDKW